jgi:hypothetical protein
MATKKRDRLAERLGVMQKAEGAGRKAETPARARRQAPETQDSPDEPANDGGFLGLGNKDSFLRKALNAVVPAAVAFGAPEMAGGFGQSFFARQDQMGALARQQEQEREGKRRENAMMLFEMFQNAPQNFAAMAPETIMSIAEPVAEQLQQPVDQVIAMMQQQAQQATLPTTGQMAGMATGLAPHQPEAAQQVMQQIPGFEGVEFQPEPGKERVTPDQVARLKENFTDESSNEALAAIDSGVPMAQVGQLLKWRGTGAGRIPAKEQEAMKAAYALRNGETPDPISQQAYNDYFGLGAPGLSPGSVAGVVTGINELATTLVTIDPENERAKAMLDNSVGTARTVLKNIETLQGELKRPLLPAELEIFVRERAQQLMLSGQNPEPVSTETEDAAVAKAAAELGPGASEDDILDRAEEIMSGDQ